MILSKHINCVYEEGMCPIGQLVDWNLRPNQMLQGQNQPFDSFKWAVYLGCGGVDHRLQKNHLKENRRNPFAMANHVRSDPED